MEWSRTSGCHSRLSSEYMEQSVLIPPKSSKDRFFPTQFIKQTSRSRSYPLSSLDSSLASYGSTDVCLSIACLGTDIKIYTNINTSGLLLQIFFLLHLSLHTPRFLQIDVLKRRQSGVMFALHSYSSLIRPFRWEGDRVCDKTQGGCGRVTLNQVSHVMYDWSLTRCDQGFADSNRTEVPFHFAAIRSSRS